jgi:hypothetical protein
MNIKVMQRYFEESSIELVATYNFNFIPKPEDLTNVTTDLENKI